MELKERDILIIFLIGLASVIAHAEKGYGVNCEDI